jgi:hypothetical protein
VPNATYSKKINKAFVIEPKDLQYFYAEGKKFMQAYACSSFTTQVIAIVKNLDTILIREEPDSIIDYSNPRKNEITSIGIYMKSEDEEHLFEMTFENTPFDPPAHICVGGNSTEEVDPCTRKLEAEIIERAQWYSFISNRVWVIRYRWIFLSICIFLVILGLGSTFMRQHQLNQARAKIELILSTYGENISDKNEIEMREKAKDVLNSIDKARSPAIVIKWVFIWIGIFFLSKFTERSIHYLFPRVVFEIGAAKKRYDTIKKIRKHVGYWIMTLIVGLILLIVSWKFGIK